MEPPGTAELRAGDSRVVIVPALGARIVALELAGRQWLWTAPGLDAALARGGANGTELGGLDECFPTVAAATIELGADTLSLPEGGELAARRAETHIATPDGVMEAVSTWHGERLPFRFVRTVRLTADAQMEMTYEAVNDGKRPFPFIWAARPIFALTQATRILVPQRARVRVAAQRGIELGAVGVEHQWPNVKLEKRVLDLSRPERVARKYGCKLFVDPVGGTIALEEPPLRLELIVDPREVPDIGIWINRRGGAPGKWGRGVNLVSLQPAIGAPDSLADALGTWKGAHQLRPGKPRRWTVRWRVRRVEDVRPEP
ncbi:MAG TPA: hypothetical protein VMM18_18095 [Gemmatimonadaceae bacterium]|nr:hypothetical protein [Gemmatimonadaceae bacterium]